MESPLLEVAWLLFTVASLVLIVTPGQDMVFYFAFLPRFVLPGAAHPTLSVCALGLAFAALTFLVKGPVGDFAGKLYAWPRARPGFLVWLYRSSGAILIGLGVRLAFERRE